MLNEDYLTFAVLQKMMSPKILLQKVHILFAHPMYAHGHLVKCVQSLSNAYFNYLIQQLNITDVCCTVEFSNTCTTLSK